MISARTYRVAFAPVTLIALIHIAGGLTMLYEPQAAEVSGFRLLGMIPAHYKGWLFIGVGVAALIARCYPMRIWSTVLLVPQQFVLLLQLAGIVVSIRLGAYPDGYVPASNGSAHLFIWGDQLAWVFLCVSHLLDMLFTPGVEAAHSRSEVLQKTDAETLAWYRRVERERLLKDQPQSPSPPTHPDTQI